MQRPRHSSHTLGRSDDDLAWMAWLREAPVEEVRRRWAQADKNTPGWKLVALARRLVALGQPLSLPERLVAALTRRREAGAPEPSWAALPNLLRLAGRQP